MNNDNTSQDNQETEIRLHTHRYETTSIAYCTLSCLEYLTTCNIQILPRTPHPAPFWAHIEIFHHLGKQSCEIVITDISECKALEKALHHYEMQMYAILQALPHGVLILNAAGTVEMCNSAAEKILRLSASQIIEKHTPAKGLWAIYDDGKPIEEAMNF